MNNKYNTAFIRINTNILRYYKKGKNINNLYNNEECIGSTNR